MLVLRGFIYGILLYKKEPNIFTNNQFIVRTIISVILVTVIVNMGLNTLWTSIISGKAFMVLFATRIVNQLIMAPIHVIVILFLEKILRKPFDNYIRSSDD